jgi:peptidoglycan hydrolase-like protein with peptidoglycan-binding domain
VAAVQRALGLPADGVFGAQTARAVRAFQSRKGLAVDGVVGPQTRGALGLAAAPATPAPTGSTMRGSATPQQTTAAAPSGSLQRIAQCESGGNPRAIGGSGRYRGKYQFSYQTWRSVGGSGDPAAASEAEQDRRAAALMQRGGSGQWPVCGR